MNVDIEYSLHKSRIQEHLQEAEQAAKQKKREEKAEGKSKISLMLTSLANLLIPGK